VGLGRAPRGRVKRRARGEAPTRSPAPLASSALRLSAGPGFGSCCFFAHGGLIPPAPAGAVRGQGPPAAAARAGGEVGEDAAQNGALGKAGPYAPPACALGTAEDVLLEGAFEVACPIEPRGALTLWVGTRRPECLLLARDLRGALVPAPSHGIFQQPWPDFWGGCVLSGAGPRPRGVCRRPR